MLIPFQACCYQGCAILARAHVEYLEGTPVISSSRDRQEPGSQEVRQPPGEHIFIHRYWLASDGEGRGYGHAQGNPPTFCTLDAAWRGQGCPWPLHAAYPTARQETLAHPPAR